MSQPARIPNADPHSQRQRQAETEEFPTHVPIIYVKFVIRQKRSSPRSVAETRKRGEVEAILIVYRAAKKAHFVQRKQMPMIPATAAAAKGPALNELPAPMDGTTPVGIVGWAPVPRMDELL